MPGLSERLALVVSLDAQGAVRGLESVGKAADRNLGRVESKLDKAGHRMQKVGSGMMASAGIAAVGLYKAGQAAADLEQAVGGTEAVFKDAGGYIDKYAKNAASKMGLSERAFREATTGIGGQLKGVGFSIDEAAEKSVELTGIAADLAATFGGTTADAVAALGSAFRGEADPAEQFNLRLNQNTVNAKAVQMGLAATTSEVDAHAKAQATLALIMEQSADAQGQFARETGSASGAMQIANAELENAKAALGESVAPIMADIAGKAAGLARGFSDLNEKSGGLASTLATYGTIGLGAAGGLSYVVGKTIELRKSIKDLGNLGGVKGALAGMGAAVAGLAAAWALYDDTISSAKASGEKATEGIRSQFEGLDKSGLTMEKLRGIVQGLDSDITNMSNDKRGSHAPWDADYRAELGASIESGKAFRSEINDQMYAAQDLAREMGITEDAALQMLLTDEGVGGALNETTGEFDTQAAAAAALQSQIEDLNNALRAQFDPLFAAQDAAAGLAEAQLEAAAAAKEHGKGSAEAMEANQKATRAALDYESAMLDLNGAVESGDVKLDDAIGTLNRWVDQGYISREAANQAAWAFGGLAEKANSVPESVSTTVTAKTDDANAKVAAFKAYLASIPHTVEVTVNGRTGTRPNVDYRTGHAEGGPIYRAGGGPSGTDTVPAWLTPGEFVMQKSAVDTIGLKAMSQINQGHMPAAGGSTSVTVQVMSADPQAVVEAVDRYVRRNGKPRWVA